MEVTIRRYLSLLSGIALGLLAAQGAIADDHDRNGRSVGTRFFAGMWQAIDSQEGSTQLLSVTCDSRRECDVRLNDTLFSVSCDNQLGFARGIGEIIYGVLTVDLSLSCGGQTLTQLNEFVPDLKNRTLININDDPKIPVIFHKISR